jgi:Peptidase family M48
MLNKKAVKFFFTIIYFLSTTILLSQNYIPIDTTKHEKKDLFLKEYSTRNTVFIEEVKSKYDSKVAKYIANSYTEFSGEFSNEIKKGRFIFEDEILDYANKVYAEIKKANPQLENLKVKILVSKDRSLNAYCIVDGTFVLNIGLFYWLDNEDQLAGVLSHEIAHKILEHSLKKQQREFLENKNIKQKISSLKREKYKVSDKTLALVKERLYESGEKAKKQEFEADSLGYVLYRNTKFSKSEYVSTLSLMQKYDSIKPAGLNQEVYKKYFNLPTQPFDDKWLLKEDFSSYDYSKFTEIINRDSIASHPETEERISKILTLFPETKEKVKPYEPNKVGFDKISKIAYLETIPNLYHNEDYGLSIYVSLLYLERDKANESYFKEWLGKSFTKILEARKSYTLNRYLDRIAPKEQSESYQQFLSFIWNLKVNEIQEIANFYTPK